MVEPLLSFPDLTILKYLRRNCPSSFCFRLLSLQPSSCTENISSTKGSGLDSGFRLLKIGLYLMQLCRLHNLGNLQKNIGPLVFEELTLKRTFRALSSSPIAQSLVTSVRIIRCFLRNRSYKTPLELLSGCR